MGNCVCGKVLKLDDKFCPQCGKPCNRMMKERGEILAELIVINGIRDRILNSAGTKNREQVLKEVSALLLTCCIDQCLDWVLGNSEDKPSGKIEELTNMIEKKMGGNG